LPETCVTPRPSWERDSMVTVTGSVDTRLRRDIVQEFRSQEAEFRIAFV